MFTFGAIDDPAKFRLDFFVRDPCGSRIGVVGQVAEIDHQRQEFVATCRLFKLAAVPRGKRQRFDVDGAAVEKVGDGGVESVLVFDDEVRRSLRRVRFGPERAERSFFNCAERRSGVEDVSDLFNRVTAVVAV